MAMADTHDVRALVRGPVHLTGIKGTGMAALAEILHHRGCRISGSDGPERYFTDELLERISVVPRVGFSRDHVPRDAAVLVYSAAYGEDNPERQEAARRGIPAYSYVEALAGIAREAPVLCVSGVHGKTSTTAMIGTMIRDTPLAATVVVGSSVPAFGGSATLCQGTAAMIVEACEYRRHFLEFSPTVALVSSIESDHQDYYPEWQDMYNAFLAFARQIVPHGFLVYCADDPGAVQLAREIQSERRDITTVSYGTAHDARWRAVGISCGAAEQHFALDVSPGEGALPAASSGDTSSRWRIAVPGEHMVVNAVGAVAALQCLTTALGGGAPELIQMWRENLASFRGTRRRSEIVGEACGILVMDDYAHHPTAVRTTLEGYRDFFPGRRIVVDFMSHTYSRSAALIDQFAQAFHAADMLILNDIYPSAREHYTGGMDSQAFARRIGEYHPAVHHIADFSDTVAFLLKNLKAGDLLVTMGAGDNFRIGRQVLDRLHEGTCPGGTNE